MAAFSITIPAITCSFSCSIHPHALHLLEVADAWLVDRCKPIAAAWPQCKLATRLYAADHLVSSAFGLSVALFYANAVHEQRVIPVLKLMNWYFMLDNCVDEPGMWGTDPAMSARIIDSIMAVFVPTSNVCKPADTPVMQAAVAGRNIALINQELARIFTTTAAEWWSDMCVDMPLSQQACFCELFRLYLSCVLKENPFRSARAPPDVQTYFRVRSHTVGWYPLDVLSEYTLCMELEQDAIANPLLKALKKCACEALAIVNDIASFRKEYESGDYFNIVMVLCFQRLKGRKGASSWSEAAAPPEPEQLAPITPELLQESMNEACEMVKERDQQCVCLIEKIKGSPELMEKPGMAAYLEAVGNQVAGNIYWHFTTGRYGHCANGESYNPAPEEIEEGMARALAARTILLKQPHP